jgi:hypothetical protein
MLSARRVVALTAILLSCGVWLAGVSGALAAQSDLAVYTDSLQNNWASWSWATVNVATSTPTHSGSASISVSCTNWQALYLGHDALDASLYTNLTFWINGGTGGGQVLLVQATVNGNPANAGLTLSALSANTWQLITLPLSSLGLTNQPTFNGFWIQSKATPQVPVFYVDDITLTASSTPPITNTPVSIAVDAQLNRHPINPLIYGVAFASSNQLADGNFTLNRSGGNAESRYNWQLNAHNHGFDWYFESIADDVSTPAGTADEFVANSKNGGAQPMLTIPMIGWAPKLGASRGKLSSYSIAKYGPQGANDWEWMPDAGNGLSSTNSNKPITSNDPNDANFSTNAAFQQAFVQHLTNRWKWSTNGGVSYYCMDNEHTIWHSSHQDVHPVGTTMQEIRTNFFAYAGVVKALDPNALVLAPEEWGWSGYFYSGYDQQNSGNHDRSNNGGWDYCPWLLSQFYQRATNTNQRLLDYFTLHCYPQGNEFSSDVSTAMQLLRNRSTRQLWDTNYVDASWIGQQGANNILMLIPRMKNWVAAYYPGTKTGITEYNWGAEGHINGATAQADVLGIFGREGLDLANRWTAVATTNIVHKAMKMYRNYDGNKSTFGDTSVKAATPNPDNVSAFAALRSSDNALTLMVINKQLTTAAAATVTVTNRLLSGVSQVWQLTSANVINRLADITVTGGVFTNTVPAQSITLYVLPFGTPPPPPRVQPGRLSSTNTFDLWLSGTAGQRYALLSSSNLVSWAPVQTNTISSNTWHIVLPATAPPRYYRGQWAP